MNTFSLEIKKADVYDEVVKTTSYIGAKMMDADATAYNRISATSYDQEMFSRFWLEAYADATTTLREYLGSKPLGSDTQEDSFSATLNMPNNFDASVKGAMEKGLFSYFVNYIVSKWCEMTSKDNAEGYSTEAQAALSGVRNLLYHRKRPSRPTYPPPTPEITTIDDDYPLI